MAEGYILINQSRQEAVRFAHIAANTKRELAGCPEAAAITTWYMLEHPEDRIAFVSDTYDEWPFETGSWMESAKYKDVTDEVVAKLIEVEILRDEGREIFDEKEPDIYIRRLRNVWREE